MIPRPLNCVFNFKVAGLEWLANVIQSRESIDCSWKTICCLSIVKVVAQNFRGSFIVQSDCDEQTTATKFFLKIPQSHIPSTKNEKLFAFSFRFHPNSFSGRQQNAQDGNNNKQRPRKAEIELNFPFIFVLSRTTAKVSCLLALSRSLHSISGDRICK